MQSESSAIVQAIKSTAPSSLLMAFEAMDVFDYLPRLVTHEIEIDDGEQKTSRFLIQIPSGFVSVWWEETRKAGPCASSRFLFPASTKITTLRLNPFFTTSLGTTFHFLSDSRVVIEAECVDNVEFDDDRSRLDNTFLDIKFRSDYRTDSLIADLVFNAKGEQLIETLVCVDKAGGELETEHKTRVGIFYHQLDRTRVPRVIFWHRSGSPIPNKTFRDSILRKLFT
jgi:hypothetical protein